VAVLGCAFIEPAAKQSSTLDDAPSVSIYVVSHGWHTGIVMRRSDVPAGLWPERADFPEAEYLEVGWGDRAYYMAPAFDLWITIKAGLWPTASALHVVGFSGPIMGYFPRSDIVELELSARRLEPLVRLIHDSHAREGAERVAPLRRGLYGNSRFYPSGERFHLFNTCNVWTARALRAAGFPISTPLALTAAGVLGQVRQFGRCLRCNTESNSGPLFNPAALCR